MPPDGAPAESRIAEPPLWFRVGTAIGVILMVLGTIAILVSLIGGRGDQVATTPTSTVPVTAADTSTTAERTGEFGGTTVPLAGNEIGEGTAPVDGGRKALRGFGEARVTITAKDGTVCEVCLMAATTSAQRQRGLMEVTDPELGGYDGMLFVSPNEVAGAFWMRNTPLPLSIAYFDGERRFVSAVDMTPCIDTAQCESYPSEGLFQYAIEVPKGAFPDLGVAKGSTFVIDGWTCPLASGTP